MSAKMKKLIAGVFTITLLLSCEDDLQINTDKNTYYDDISDITMLNGHFFSTNYDLSGHAGSQIDLLKFDEDGAGDYYIDGSFDLDMNGQGYIAITNDGEDLYLQSRNTSLLISCSPIAQQAYSGMDDIATNWQPSGLAYDGDKDSLLALYRNREDRSQYRLRTLSKSRELNSGGDAYFSLDFIDQGYSGIYALEYFNQSFYMLAVDTTQTDALIILDQAFQVQQIESILDSTVVGLCFNGNELFFSYRDKRIEKWNSY